MNRSTLQSNIILVATYLFILLFVYAAVSKLLDFDTFETQLGQSPLLSAYASWVAWLVPISELGIALFLSIPQFRTIGFYGFYGMMVMFTTYIIIILNFTSFTPCSCGGVLEQLGWKEHILFNIVFIILALVALLINWKQNIANPFIGEKRFIASSLTIMGVSIGGIIIVIILYVFSESEIHRNNSFIRSYPPHPVNTIKGIDIKYNSYYIAGASDGYIYLGNTTAPSHILKVDTTLSDFHAHQIQLKEQQDITFFSPQIRIKDSLFFLIDGGVPMIFKGNVSNWEANLLWKGDPHMTFSRVEVITPSQFMIGGFNQHFNENVIGRIDLGTMDTVKVTTKLLQKQLDGIFDTDGMLRYNSDLERLLYVYYYRNEFITADFNLKLDYHGRTIDTVQKAVIKTATTKAGIATTLSQPPLIVNHQSHTSGQYLFIESDRLGRYEPEEMLKDASIIDVYDLVKQTYEFSFYLYNYKMEKIKSFQIYNNILIGLSEHYLVLYRLEAEVFDILKLNNARY